MGLETTCFQVHGVAGCPHTDPSSISFLFHRIDRVMIYMASKSIALLLVGLIIGGALGIYGIDYIDIPGLGGGYLSLYEELQEDYATLTDEHVELLGNYDDLSAALDALHAALFVLEQGFLVILSLNILILQKHLSIAKENIYMV